MVQIHEIINDLDGNGIDSVELLHITEDLTQLAIIKDRIIRRLSHVYEGDELNEMISVVKKPNDQQIVMADFLSVLSKREKQCYFKCTFEKKPFSLISEECGISKSAVQQYIERARKKLQNVI